MKLVSANFAAKLRFSHFLYRIGFTLSLSILCSALLPPGLHAYSVVRTSQHSNYTAAVAALKENDVLLCDNNNAQYSTALPKPPNGVQVIGGKAIWNLEGDGHDLIFFNHQGSYIQKSGILKHCQFYSLDIPSSFVGLDSCLINFRYRDRAPLPNATPYFQFRGFIRALTIMDSFVGTSAGSLNHNRKHYTTFQFNITDPVGNGVGTLLANFVTHGSMDWQDVHIINGRGITIAHHNTEYQKYADPVVTIENGAECTLLHMNPGGYEPGPEANKADKSSFGLTVYPRKSFAGAVFRMGGQYNQIVQGVNYKSYQAGVLNGDYEPHLALKDPYARVWGPKNQVFALVNMASPKQFLVYNTSPRFSGPGAANCSDPWDSDGCAKWKGYLQTASGDAQLQDYAGNVTVKNIEKGTLPWGPKLYRNYLPRLPDLKAGLGTDYSKKSITEIQAALDKGEEIYLAEGNYSFTKTVSLGQIWGAGIDKTVLEFPSEIRAFEGKGTALNLTVKGGKVGFAQTLSVSVPDFAKVRFTGQSLCAITLGNAQQNAFHNLVIDNVPNGFTTCSDNINCGEDGTPGGSSMLDKVSLYGIDFHDISGKGVDFRAGVNGYSTVMGCTFKNVGMGVNMVRAGDKGRGWWIHGCDFENVDKAGNLVEDGMVTQVTVKGKGNSSTGFSGDIRGVINADIQNVGVAIEGLSSFATVFNVTSSGSITNGEGTWVAKSKFSNLDVSQGAKIGNVDISDKIDKSEPAFDATAPSAPGNVKVTKIGMNNLVSWTPSTDTESGITEYVIARTFAQAEIARVGLDWGFGDARNNPGARNAFLDTTANGKDAKYFVIAVNGARIRSDNTMDFVRFWGSNFDGSVTLESGGKQVDTVRVPIGPYSTIQAVDYSKTRLPTVAIKVSGNPQDAFQKATKNFTKATGFYAVNGSVSMYNLSGMLTVHANKWNGDFQESSQFKNLRPGIYWLLQGRAIQRVLIK